MILSECCCFLKKRERREREREIKSKYAKSIIGVCVCVLNHSSTFAVSGCGASSQRRRKCCGFPFPTFGF